MKSATLMVCSSENNWKKNLKKLWVVQNIV